MYVVKNENNTKVQLANQNQIRCNVSILKNKEKIQVRSVKNLGAFEWPKEMKWSQMRILDCHNGWAFVFHVRDLQNY